MHLYCQVTSNLPDENTVNFGIKRCLEQVCILSLEDKLY